MVHPRTVPRQVRSAATSCPWPHGVRRQYAIQGSVSHPGPCLHPDRVLRDRLGICAATACPPVRSGHDGHQPQLPDFGKRSGERVRAKLSSDVPSMRRPHIVRWSVVSASRKCVRIACHELYSAVRPVAPSTPARKSQSNTLAKQALPALGNGARRVCLTTMRGGILSRG